MQVQYDSMTSLQKKIYDMRLDRFNNYLTTERFAEYYEISVNLAEAIINEGNLLEEHYTKE